MRYPKEHKAETRQRILEAAAPLFRSRGLDGVSVSDVMSAAGLTHGGFYAHFESKEALVSEIMAREAGLVRMMRERPGPESEDLGAQALRILSDYMAPENRHEVAAGCPLVSMPVDAVRGPDALREGYARRFGELAKELTRGGPRESDAIAAAILAVGSVLVSRTFDDPKQAAKVARACRREVTRLLSSDGE